MLFGKKTEIIDIITLSSDYQYEIIWMTDNVKEKLVLSSYSDW